MRKMLFLLAVVAALIVGASSQAQAAPISVTPDTGVLNVTRWQGDDSSQNAIDAIIGPIMLPFGSLELYKNDAPATESGALGDSYTTVLSANDGTITYNGGPIVGPTAFLLVKDGNASPNWYLFNLTAIFGWDGQETLELSGFFPGPGNQGGGAISHVTLYGTEGEGEDGGGGSGGTVPEPATLVLFGAALAVAGARLRRRN